MHSILRFASIALGAAVLAGAAVLLPASSPAPAQAEETSATSCEVTGGTLDWGVKESFRSYISGSIAGGSWEVSEGASYETPSFHWADPVGSIDADTGKGSVSFTGTIAFTGHEGVLNLVFANPTIEFRGDGTANLLLDARSNNAQGELAVDEAQVSVGRIDGLGGIDPTSGSGSVADAPAILTADGAQAFAGFYGTGDELDPISLSLEFAPCSASAAAPVEDAANADEATMTPISADVDEPGVPWIPIAIGVAAILVIAAAAILLLAGRKKPTEADGSAEDDPAA